MTSRRIFADRLLLLRFVYGGVYSGQGVLGLLSLARPQTIVKSLQQGSEAASIASINASMLQVLSVCFQCRRMIRHSRHLPLIVELKPGSRTSRAVKKPLCYNQLTSMSNHIFSLTKAGIGPKISFRDASALLDRNNVHRAV